MKVIVKEVYEGAEEQGQILEFWIKVQFANGESIEIFNWGEFDLRKYINREVNCLILAMLRKNPLIINQKNSKILEGVYLGEYIIPEKWKKYSKGHVLVGYHGLKTNKGKFLVEPDDLHELSINKGDKVKFNVLRYDLLAWYLIE